MKYILDFDRTLFDTDLFIKQVVADGHQETLMTPKIWDQYAVIDFLYPDVFPWLSTKQTKDLHILTAWTPGYGLQAEAMQQKKLTAANLESLVAAITFISGDKGKPAAKIASQFPPQETVVFVDDLIENCLSVKQNLPNSVTCLMVRNPEIVSEIPVIPVVHTLYDIDAMIGSL